MLALSLIICLGISLGANAEMVFTISDTTGASCTYFVSQVLVAGRKNSTPPSNPTRSANEWRNLQDYIKLLPDKRDIICIYRIKKD